MRMCCVLALLVASLAAVSPPSSARAETPWRRMFTINRVKADPEQLYPLTEDCGPWMIMAVTFVGETAERDAQALVYELRKRYRLPAYTYEMTFDMSEQQLGRGFDAYGNVKRMRYLKYHNERVAERREIAVLVGDFRSEDDRDAQSTLRQLKYLQPGSLEYEDGDVSRPVSRPLAHWRSYLEKSFVRAGMRKREKGPLGRAFLSTNPLLPDEYYAPKGLDKFVIQMNEPVEHCLLDCPGGYSVQVATFTGSVRQTRPGESLDQDLPSRLADAADKAHRLTMALREQGYEAYEFHDRCCSVVTIGSFESVGTERPDGRTELDPGIARIMEEFDATKGSDGGVGRGATYRPKWLPNGVDFDVQPLPVVVPRRSIVQDYVEDNGA